MLPTAYHFLFLLSKHRLWNVIPLAVAALASARGDERQIKTSSLRTRSIIISGRCQPKIGQFFFLARLSPFKGRPALTPKDKLHSRHPEPCPHFLLQFVFIILEPFSFWLSAIPEAFQTERPPLKSGALPLWSLTIKSSFCLRRTSARGDHRLMGSCNGHFISS